MHIEPISERCMGKNSIEKHITVSKMQPGFFWGGGGAPYNDHNEEALPKKGYGFQASGIKKSRNSTS